MVQLKELVINGQLLKGRLQAMSDRLATRVNLTSQELSVMMGIKSKGIKNVGDISKEFFIQQANASSLCKRMEKDGLIERKRNEQDVRIVNLYLTQLGEQKVKSIIDTIHENKSVMMNEEKFAKIHEGFKVLIELIDEVERGL